MTNPIQQALAAVDEVNENIGTECYGQVRAALVALGVIRKALQSAAQEAEDWRTVERWSLRPSILDTIVEFTPPFESETRWLCTVLAATVFVTAHYGETRAMALAAAAAWLREELSK